MIADKNRLGRPKKHTFFDSLSVGQMAFVEGATIRSFSSVMSYYNSKLDNRIYKALAYNDDGSKASVGGVEGIYIRRIH